MNTRETAPIPPAIAAIAPDGWLTPAQRRRILIDISMRRIRPGAGNSPEFLRRRTAMNIWPDLRPVLQDIPWAIVGGVATRAYMPERATQDLDILVLYDNGYEAIERLKAAGYEVVTPLAVGGFLVRSPKGAEVDVLWGNYPWLQDALTHPRHDPAGFPVLDLPYLVLLKLESSRAQDVADLSRMLGLASDDDLARVREVVARYTPEQLDDLESLIYLGQVEMQDVRREDHA